MSACGCVQMSAEVGPGSYGARITGSCESPDMGLGAKLRFFVRIISPVLYRKNLLKLLLDIYH